MVMDSFHSESVLNVFFFLLLVPLVDIICGIIICGTICGIICGMPTPNGPANICCCMGAFAARLLLRLLELFGISPTTED